MMIHSWLLELLSEATFVVLFHRLPRGEGRDGAHHNPINLSSRWDWFIQAPKERYIHRNHRNTTVKKLRRSDIIIEYVIPAGFDVFI